MRGKIHSLRFGGIGRVLGLGWWVLMFVFFLEGVGIDGVRSLSFATHD
jgi:hypothetical protein